MLESCFQRLFGVIRHVEFTFPQNGGGTVCNLRFFFFFSFSVAGPLARVFEIKSRNCAKKVLCYRKTDISVYDNFSREYLSQILSGNVCKTVPCKISNMKGVDIFLSLESSLFFITLCVRNNFKIPNGLRDRGT